MIADRARTRGAADRRAADGASASTSRSAAGSAILREERIASGAIGGAVVGTIIYVGGGVAAWVLLFVTFVAASVASRLGLKRKVAARNRRRAWGRRGAGNAIANCGVAAIAASVG